LNCDKQLKQKLDIHATSSHWTAVTNTHDSCNAVLVPLLCSCAHCAVRLLMVYLAIYIARYTIYMVYPFRAKKYFFAKKSKKSQRTLG
jgi:hypothetical protein